MALTEADVMALYDAVVSVPQTIGYFDAVNGYEPQKPPGANLTCAVWLNRLVPGVNISGLSSTSAVVIFRIRLYTNAFAENPDLMDPNLTAAAVALYGAYIGNFRLDLSFVRAVDVRGIAGEGRMALEAGYITMAGPGDSRIVKRIYDITLAVICNDVWDEDE